MIVLSPLTLGLVAVIAALWLAAAVAATIRANRHAAAAEGLVDRAAWLGGLVEAAPGVPLSVAPDGTIDLPPGMDESVRFLIRDNLSGKMGSVTVTALPK